jgi:hypothetical protein
MTMLLLIGVAALIAAFAVTVLCLFVADLHRSAQLVPAVSPRFDQRRRARLRRRGGAATL